MDQIFGFLLKIIEKLVLFIQSCVSISFRVLILPFHNFFLHSTSKIPLLSFSDFISEHVFFSLISVLCIHCFTNFWLTYSLSADCVYLISSPCSVCPISAISSPTPQKTHYVVHQCYIMEAVASGCCEGQRYECFKKGWK